MVDKFNGNGNVKWIVTLVITTIIAAIAYGKQIQNIENIEKKLISKADTQVVAEKLANLKDDICEMKSNIKIIQTDLKEILIKVE